VLIIGDYTARIGDPSGRSSERPVLADEELDANAQRFAEQAFRILDPAKTEVRFNGEWLAKLSFAEVVKLTRMLTVSRLLERDDFAKRFAAREPISLSELLYPPMQAYDSVAIDADVEIGGTDQLYNLLTGRDVMERYGKEPQLVATYPLLVGLDGVEKMSKSRGNYIGILESPEEMFGKTMSIPDEALPQWWELVGGGGEHPDDPMEWKLELARRVAGRWHGEEGGRAGEEHFTRVVRRHEAPAEMPDLTVKPVDGQVYLPAVLQEAFGQSGGHWRRLVDQGGVRLDGQVVVTLEVDADTVSEAVLQAGKRQFVRLHLA
jgi:tyrosyl-tRNA synthetase